MSFSRGTPKTLTSTLDAPLALKKKEVKKEDSEESEDSEEPVRSTTRVSIREITNLDLLSYILCIRTSVCLCTIVFEDFSYTLLDHTKQKRRFTGNL